MSFVVHDTGGGHRPRGACQALRAEPCIQEHDGIDDVSFEDREQFRWMMANNIPVTQVGSRTYQIRFSD